MKYSLWSLMIAVLVSPPLLAGAYFALLDDRLLAIAFGLIVGCGFVAVALACLVAMENKLNELKENWPVKPETPKSSAPAPNPSKPRRWGFFMRGQVESRVWTHSQCCWHSPALQLCCLSWQYS
jgi:hypothetical protein